MGLSFLAEVPVGGYVSALKTIPVILLLLLWARLLTWVDKDAPAAHLPRTAIYTAYRGGTILGLFLLFFLPTMVVLFFLSIDDFLYSLSIDERGSSGAWTPVGWPAPCAEDPTRRGEVSHPVLSRSGHDFGLTFTNS